MLTVYGPAVRVGHMNASPFVGKLETWLRLAGLPYTFQPANPFKAPKGKVPYVDMDGELVGDSQLIIERLTQKHKITLDDHLSPADRAVGHAVRRMLEEGTYFCTVYTRWVRPEGWQVYKPLMGQVMPGLVLLLVRRNIRKALHAQGTGRHSDEEILAFTKADLAALATVLGDKPFLLGDRPSSVDANAYVVAYGALTFTGCAPLNEEARRHKNLEAYVARMSAAYWPPGELTRT